MANEPYEESVLGDPPTLSSESWDSMLTTSFDAPPGFADYLVDVFDGFNEDVSTDSPVGGDDAIDPDALDPDALDPDALDADGADNNQHDAQHSTEHDSQHGANDLDDSAFPHDGSPADDSQFTDYDHPDLADAVSSVGTAADDFGGDHDFAANDHAFGADDIPLDVSDGIDLDDFGM